MSGRLRSNVETSFRPVFCRPVLAYSGEGVLRVEANRWKLLGLLFDIAQQRFGTREIAALCEQLCCKQIPKLDIERVSSPLGKKSGFVDVLLRICWTRTVQKKRRECLIYLVISGVLFSERAKAIARS